MKNYEDREERYPPKPKAKADNTLRVLHNSSYHTKAEFDNCFIISSYISRALYAQNEFNRVLKVGKVHNTQQLCFKLF